MAVPTRDELRAWANKDPNARSAREQDEVDRAKRVGMQDIINIDHQRAYERRVYGR